MCPSPQAAEHSRDAAWVAVTRISGIVFGVFLSLLLCVLVFPKSATHEAVDNMWHAFADLSALNALAWSGGRTEGPPGGLLQIWTLDLRPKTLRGPLPCCTCSCKTAAARKGPRLRTPL